MKMNVKLNEGVSMPTYGTSGSAAFDLAAEKDYVIRNINAEQKAIMVSTGVSVAIPKGYAGFLYLRSSMCKTTMRMSNHVGVIDSDYRGVIHVPIEVNARTVCTIEKGERIAQLVITKVEQMDLVAVDDLDKTKRGKGGFGSTGKKAGEVNE